MKKLFVLLFVFGTTMTFAQLSKENFLTGGTLSFSSSKTDNPNGSGYTSSESNVELSPRIGLFLSDRSVIGMELGYRFRKNKYDYTDSPGTTDKMSVFLTQPFYRYYFPVNEKISFYLHGKAGVSLGKNNQHYSYLNPTTGLVVITEQKSELISGELSLTPGIAFFITPKWVIETTVSSLGYRYSKVKPGGGERSTFSTFGFQYNVFSFGLSWYLSK